MHIALTVVVPVYGNAATLDTLAARIAATFGEGAPTYRLLFVVDCSPDDSWDRVCRLADRDPRVAGVLLSRNIGQHRAILVGLRLVVSNWMAVMDADLQDPPEVLSAMWVLAQQRGLPVAARRRGQYQGVGRMLTSRVFKSLLGLWLDMPPDVGTFLLLPRSVRNRMAQAAVASPQVVVMSRCFSREWAYVDYRRDMRAVGESAYSGWARWRAAIRSVRCAQECRRLLAGGQARGAAGEQIQDDDRLVTCRVG
jgi:glycosyltransferase involved in cell wall biosynthesis